MPPFARVLLPLALVLPIAAFVVGSFVTTAGEEPPPRPVLELTDVPATAPSAPPPAMPEPTPVRPRPGTADESPWEQSVPDGPRDRDDDDRDDEDDRDDRDDRDDDDDDDEDDDDEPEDDD